MSSKKPGNTEQNTATTDATTTDASATGVSATGATATTAPAKPVQAITPTRPGRFADLGRLQVQETVNERTKKFLGTGNEFLIVPGLVKLEGVRIGQQEIPLTEERAYPTDANGQFLDKVNEEIISVQAMPDGRPVLLRSVLSNDGVWQKGAAIYVTGEWNEDKAQSEATAADGTVDHTLVPNAEADIAAGAGTSTEQIGTTSGGQTNLIG
jgi:hypothetical protein